MQSQYEELPELPPDRTAPKEPGPAPEDNLYEDIGSTERPPQPVSQRNKGAPNAYEEISAHVPQQKQEQLYEEAGPPVPVFFYLNDFCAWF